MVRYCRMHVTRYRRRRLTFARSPLTLLLLIFLVGCQLAGALDGARLDPIELPITGPVADVEGDLLYTNGITMRRYRISDGVFRDVATFSKNQVADGAVLSPDGSTIAFSVFHLGHAQDDPHNGADLMLMEINGTHPRRLLASAGAGEWLTRPAWSPDGMSLVFTREHPGESPRVERVGVDGQGRTVLVPNGHSPTMSPDGRRLAFLRDEPGGSQGLYVGEQDGSEARVVVTDVYFDLLAAPRFAPVGDQIAFVGVGGPPQNIGARMPRNSRLAFWLTTRVASAHGVPWELWLVDGDGQGLRRLTDLSEDAPMPAWSPDGHWIALKGELGFYLVEPRTGDTRRLVQELAGDGITWVP
jgi:Tol biopolymer transport system component